MVVDTNVAADSLDSNLDSGKGYRCKLESSLNSL
jgi:hypothetical protein